MTSPRCWSRTLRRARARRRWRPTARPAKCLTRITLRRSRWTGRSEGSAGRIVCRAPARSGLWRRSMVLRGGSLRVPEAVARRSPSARRAVERSLQVSEESEL
uniref:(northern house mosquito) hypothetical protein n=1 Tax=Culex pipiens TaxID=7175 RepID=A0A8D7ZVC6_CULPI